MSSPINEIMEKANLPSSPSKVRESVDQTEVYQNIYHYYDDEDKLVEPISYKISTPVGERSIKSMMGVVPNNDMKIKSFTNSDVFFSTYSEEAMADLGINKNEIWNGEVASFSYTYDGKLKYAETDYYTKAMFSSIPYLEACNATYEGSSEYPGRDMLIPDVGKFNDRPSYCTGGTIGGVIIGVNSDGEYELLLGERSEEPIINKGRISIAPNHLLKPKEVASNDIKDWAKQSFKEELFGYKTSGLLFFDENIDAIELINGWNLRHGSMTINYGFIIESSDDYEDFVNEVEENMEFERLVRVSFDDYEKMNQILRFDRMSPSVIPVVIEGIRYVLNNSNKEYNYSFERH